MCQDVSLNPVDIQILITDLFRNERLRAWAFSTTNAQHLLQLKMMGIEVEIDENGRVLLTHHANAVSFFILGLFTILEVHRFSLYKFPTL